ncbi:MAG TPA: UTP--glucose-1-phosphate uridylyltransferase [Candidatus Saccharimonadales bacterium]|jgi:UTP--glucose-1-phosphate uridylyltransferase|nr:UTP--glucose-1-phosphate uridylyltransferase [Candidatus Saccharimonadales bacterium]
MYRQPTKAIICAAGLGTRFLPQTKAMPKEMLPIIDRPVIQLIVEEAVAAGVTDIIIVTGSTKRAIEDHFDRSYELENELRAKGKDELAETLKNIAEMASFVYVRQKGLPKGNARPVLNARHLIDDGEPFFVFFADDFFRSDVPRATQLKDAYNKTGKSVISLNEVDAKDADKYGMAATADDLGDGTFKITQLVEKPGADKTPSNFASVGGYLLTADILPIIAEETVDASGEVTLSDSINKLAQKDAVYGQFIKGVWHDTGDQLKYLKAVVDTALTNEKLGADFRTYLEQRLTSAE